MLSKVPFNFDILWMILGLEIYLAQCLAYDKCLINVAYLHNLLLLPLLNVMNFYYSPWIAHIGKLFGITWLGDSFTELWNIQLHFFLLGQLQSIHYEFIIDLQNLSLEDILKVNFHLGRHEASYNAEPFQYNSSVQCQDTPLWILVYFDTAA